MNNRFDFPMSGDWERAYGLASDNRPSPNAPTPKPSVHMVREVVNFSTLRSLTQFSVEDEDIDADNVRMAAKEIAAKMLRYSALTWDGREIEIVRFFRRGNEPSRFFWVEWYYIG